MDITYKRIEEKKWETSEGSGELNKALVHHKGEFYIVSENTELRETLIFPATPIGDIKNWSEVGSGSTLDEVLNNFSDMLYESPNWINVGYKE